MIDNCYTFKELNKKYGWNSKEGGIKAQIRYAQRRGVEIEKAFKKGSTYFRILSENNEIQNDENWSVYPKNPRYEVSKTGQVRVVETKQLVGANTSYGYMAVTDTTSNPSQYYKIHRMVMETFNPIENSDFYVVDHIDGNKHNNNLNNLRWVLQRQNIQFRDENWADISQKVQKLIEIKGYDWVNALLTVEIGRIS